jgi:hypothetical protein
VFITYYSFITCFDFCRDHHQGNLLGIQTNLLKCENEPFSFYRVCLTLIMQSHIEWQWYFLHSSSSSLYPHDFVLGVASVTVKVRWPLRYKGQYVSHPVTYTATVYSIGCDRQILKNRTSSEACSDSDESSPRPYPFSLKSVLILSSRLRLGLPSSLFPSCFPAKIIYAFLFSPIYATCLAHSTFLDFIARIMLGEEYKVLKLIVGFSSVFCYFLLFPKYIS